MLPKKATQGHVTVIPRRMPALLLLFLSWSFLVSPRYNQMAAAVQLPAGNQLCAFCHQYATQFCLCNLSGVFFCDSCASHHFKVPSGNVHMQLPISEFASTQVPNYRAKIIQLMFKRQEMNRQVLQLDIYKDLFCEQVRDLHQHLHIYQEKMTQSIQGLQEELGKYVAEGYEEAKSALDAPQDHQYRTSVARELNESGGDVQLISCLTNFERLFETAKKAVNEAKVTFQMPCVSMKSELQYQGEVKLVGDQPPKDRPKRRRRKTGIELRTVVVSMVLACFVAVCLGRGMPELHLENRKCATQCAGWEAENSTVSEINTTSTSEVCQSGFGRIEYPTGELYEGGQKAGKRHGVGRLVTEGEVCEGMWKEDEFTGWGQCMSVNSTMRSGQWKQGKLNGLGRLTAQGNISIGWFRDDQLFGLGVKFTSSESFTVGVWANDTYNGNMTEFDPSGVRWGTYKEGELQGNLTVLERNGARYTGEWRDGVKHGRGVESYPAEYFEGVWEEGSRTKGVYNYTHRFRRSYEDSVWSSLQSPSLTLERLRQEEFWVIAGLLHYSNGVYSGQVNSHGQRHGYGVLNYTQGRSYEGHWRYNQWFGPGRYRKHSHLEEGYFDGRLKCGVSASDNNTRHGMFNSDGLLEGYGAVIETKSSGEILRIGKFVNGTLEGFGAYTGGDITHVGVHSKGRLSARGALIWMESAFTRDVNTSDFPGVFVYVGEFVDGLRHGFGREYTKSSYWGQWMQGRKIGGTCLKILNSTQKSC